MFLVLATVNATSMVAPQDSMSCRVCHVCQYVYRMIEGPVPISKFTCHMKSRVLLWSLPFCNDVRCVEI